MHVSHDTEDCVHVGELTEIVIWVDQWELSNKFSTAKFQSLEWTDNYNSY